MKKQLLLFIALMMSVVASAQVTIQMEKDGGVYKVPCTVNGVKMKFIFDTGAATVSMSQTMAQFLLDGEYLSVSDIKGVGQSVVADGTIVNHASVVLRDIEIGGLHLNNIQAIVLESQNAPLLLGQTAISELGRISIDGNKLIIHAADNELTDEQIDQLGEQAAKYIDAESYAAAIECLERIDEAVGLSEYGLWSLCYCYSQNHQDDLCIQACNRWISEFEDSDEYNDKRFIYGYLASSYEFGKEDYNKALLWYQKELTLLDREKNIMWNKQRQANCYMKTGQPYKAKRLLGEVISWHYKQLGVGTNNLSKNEEQILRNVAEGKIHNEDLGRCLFDFALIEYEIGDNSGGDRDMICAAQLGYKLAQNYCNAYLRQLYPGTPWNFR